MTTNTDAGVVEMARLREAAEQALIPESLGAFVRERAQAMGDAPAAVWFEDGVSLTYRALDEAADRLASGLLRIGVRKGTHVAVMLPNVAAFPVTWIAIGRIGAVMIPVNTAYTADELQFVVKDSDSQFLIIDHAFLEIWRASSPQPLIDDARVIVHGGERAGLRGWDELCATGAAPFLAPSPVARTDLLTIQYTSGTTGFPKGCLLSHDYWMIIGHNAALFRKGDGDIRNILIWAPFFYMDPMWQFLMTLKLGATAYIAARMSLSRFFDWLKEYKIHYCIFPEPALKQREPSPRDRDLSLQYVSIYGWRKEARLEVERRFGVIAREGYGMTEVGNATIMPAAAARMAGERTCGLAAAFRELRIVDKHENDVADGESGELWVAGRAILWGYYKRPEANAESFRGRWFRTGDIFVRGRNGYYFIVGRIKDMIKRAGENIAAQEVEAVLRDMDPIEEAAVVAVPDPVRREEVKAYVKLREGLTRAHVPPEDILAHCEKRLAKFKVPRYIAYVEDFPRTPTRKIAKKRLIAGVEDLRIGAFDRRDGVWR